MTIAYNYVTPRIKDQVLGTDPTEVHIHIRRLEVDDVPADDAEVSKWMHKAFENKDKLLAGFERDRCFPGTIPGTDISVSVGILLQAALLSLAIGFVILIVYEAPWLFAYMVACGIFLSLIARAKWLPEPRGTDRTLLS